MTRTVRSIKLGNHLTGFITLQTMFMQKNQKSTHAGALGNPRNDGLWGREWELRWVSHSCMGASLLIPSLLVNCTLSSLAKSPNQCCKLSLKSPEGSG